MAVGTVEDDAEMRAICEGVGELVLWASAIDAQLTKAVIRAYSLAETAMLDLIVARLDARAKVDILLAMSKHIKSAAWSKGITSWVKKAEKVNGYRNTVAHHQVAVSDGKLILHSEQAPKLLKRIKKDLKLAPAKNLDDINRWVKAARSAHEQGRTVLTNLGRMSAAGRKANIIR